MKNYLDISFNLKINQERDTIILSHSFQFFFTLTSADMRWSSNFTPEFEKMDATVIYEVTDEGKENVRVKVEIEGKSLEMPWQEFLKNHVEEARHSIMRRNVLLATRNFNHRVECFRQEVIFGKNNPMSVRHISYRVEFQGISLKKNQYAVCFSP